MPEFPPVLILTAGFGDGHNSAARNIAEAVRQKSGGAREAVTVDLFEEAAPVSGRFYKWCYSKIINNLPWIWSWMFVKSSRADFRSLWWDRMVGLGPALEKRLEQYRPETVVVTYPAYPYFLERIPQRLKPARVLVAVTDSITIHPIWLKGKADRLFVTDEFSREVAECGQDFPVPVSVSGFPVAPKFAGFPPRKPWEWGEGSPGPDGGGPLRVLYFATTATPHVRATLKGLAEALPAGAQLTVVTGRHETRLSPVIQEVEDCFSGFKVKRIGWSPRIPELLMEHDVVISKAGGATVHECLAAGVPVVVNYIIPGQEEGNARLLELLGCGERCMEPGRTGCVVAGLAAGGGLAAMSAAMARHRRPDGALRVADDILHPGTG